MIKIYGSVKSSAARCYWTMEEVGASYEHIPVDMMNKEHKSEAFLKLNPNGKIPVIDDNGIVVWESFAINQYLAETYKPELLGTTPAERAHVRQWDTWTLANLMHPFYTIMGYLWNKKEADGVTAAAHEELAHALPIIEAHLGTSTYLTGETFTIADLNLASLLVSVGLINMDLASYPNLQRFTNLCTSRPASQKIRAMQSA